MYRGALGLQPCPQEVERIDCTCAKSSTESTYAGSGEIRRGSSWRGWIAIVDHGISIDEVSFGVFECGEVDGGVREHADEAHWEPTIEGTYAGRSPHLGCGGGYEGVAMKTTFDGFALHTA